MATTFTGRSGSTYGRQSTYSTRTGTGTWGKTTTRTTGAKRIGSMPTVAPRYRGCYESFTWKINSYKTLYNQTRGPAKYPRPTPTILNNFANWVNKGAVVQTVTCNQVAKWARTAKKNFNTRNPTITACKNVLTSKFGKNTIKAVARAKNGWFMVVTSPTWKGKPFQFPRY